MTGMGREQGALEPIGGPVRTEESLPSALLVLGVVIISVCALIGGIFETLLVPIYIGSAVAPITVAIAVIGNLVLPRLMANLRPPAWTIALPALWWLLGVVSFAVFFSRPEGDIVIPGAGTDLYVWLALLVVGGGAAAVGISRNLPPPPGRVRGPGR